MSESIRKIINIMIAIIVAIVGWTYVIYNNDPMTEVKYKDIPVTVEGEDDLANRGLGVSQVSAETIDVTLRQKRVDTNSIAAEDITVIADVSDAVEGENGISLQISGPDGTQVAEAERRSVSVEIEESATVEKIIYVEYDEEIPGIEPVTSNLTSTQATVIGAKSEIERVDKVAALITYDESKNRVWNFTSSLSALDSDGDLIEYVVIYPREINFKAYPGTTKEVKLNVVTEDPSEKEDAESGTDKTSDTDAADESEDDEAEEEKGDGYTRTVTAPDTIVIKGPEDAIADIDEVSTELIDINSMYEDQEAPLTYILPDGVYPAYESQNLTARIRVTKEAS